MAICGNIDTINSVLSRHKSDVALLQADKKWIMMNFITFFRGPANLWRLELFDLIGTEWELNSSNFDLNAFPCSLCWLIFVWLFLTRAAD